MKATTAMTTTMTTTTMTTATAGEDRGAGQGNGQERAGCNHREDEPEHRAPLRYARIWRRSSSHSGPSTGRREHPTTSRPRVDRQPGIDGLPWVAMAESST